MIVFFIIPIVIIIFAGWYIVTLLEDPLAQYKTELGLQKANLVYANDYEKVRDIVLPTRQTAFDTSEPVIWLHRYEDKELFLGAKKKDLRLWFKPQTILTDIHIVLDNKKNNRRSTNLHTDKLPSEKIALEGNFSEYFDVYYNKDQQIVALQILSPDIMAYMIDNVIKADIEIIDNQVALIIPGGASSSDELKKCIGLAKLLDKIMGATSKVTSM